MEEGLQELSKIPTATRVFKANGREFTIMRTLTADRFARMTEKGIIIGFGVEYKELFDGYKEIYELANQQRFADIAVKAYNMMQGIGDVEDRRVPIMEYCALFILRDDEDPKDPVSDDIIASKIEDWQKEGIDFNSFFLLAMTMVRGLKETYQSHTRNTSKKE